MTAAVTVNLGLPALRPAELGIEAGGDDFIAREIELFGERGKVSCVGFDCTHCVFYVADAGKFDIEFVGEGISAIEYFPDDIETDFTQVRDEENLIVRAWRSGREIRRGVYAAAAAFTAALAEGKCGDKCTVHLEKGEVTAEWTDSGVKIAGPFELVYAL